MIIALHIGTKNICQMLYGFYYDSFILKISLLVLYLTIIVCFDFRVYIL